MKKILLAPVLFFLITALIMFSGCCHSVVITDPFPASKAAPGTLVPAASGTAQNSGYYLFNCWPLYTGHPEKYNRHDYHAFYDDINPATNAGMLMDAMHKHYGVEKLAEVEHVESSWGFFSLWLVWRRTITTTAVGLKTYKSKK